MENQTFKDLRRRAGFDTQEALSESLKMKRTTVAKWETGERYPRAKAIPMVAEVLGVTAGEIIAAITAAKETSA